MLYIAIVLGAFLFYAFVPVEHKKIVFKSLGVLFGLLVIYMAVAFSLDAHNESVLKEKDRLLQQEQEKESERERASIEITPLGLDSTTKHDVVINLGMKSMPGGPAANSFSLKICNHNSQDMARENLIAYGYYPGRSGEYQIFNEGESGTSLLQGDAIIPSNKCKVVKWIGIFKRFPAYNVSL